MRAPGGTFGPRASLSVERRDGCHFTCLRYPCVRPKQEAVHMNVLIVDDEPWPVSACRMVGELDGYRA